MGSRVCFLASGTSQVQKDEGTDKHSVGIGLPTFRPSEGLSWASCLCEGNMGEEGDRVNDASDYLDMAFAVLLGTAKENAMELVPMSFQTHARVQFSCVHGQPQNLDKNSCMHPST